MFRISKGADEPIVNVDAEDPIEPNVRAGTPGR
jgi:hypothetical protein